MKRFGHGLQEDYIVRNHPETIPFKLNDTSLIPLYGTIGTRGEHANPFSSMTVNPGETLTLNFDDVIALYPFWKNQNPLFTITPIVNNNYTLRLMGEGFQTFTVQATALP
jgi:hypothetical protein